ncbi:MAG: DPP IV N-terminal domain-containing protein [Woeseiaceae bacterium]
MLRENALLESQFGCVALALLVAVSACMPPRSGAGGKILFHSDRSSTEEIFVMDPDGSNVRQLTHVARSEVASIDAEGSPDRKQIAFSSNRTGPWDDLYVMDADGGNVRQLTNTPEVSEHDAAWSPDGRHIAYSAQPRSPIAADGTRQDRQPVQIWIIDGDGSNARALTSGSSRNALPAWSPDGLLIAFSSDRHAKFDLKLIGTDEGDWQIHLMDRDGSNVRRLTEYARAAGTPAWSPDGQHIAFNVDGDIYVTSRDGSNRRRLTDGPRVDVRPTWSLDGKDIVFNCGTARWHLVDGELRAGQHEKWEICLIRADGSGFRTLTKNEAFDGHPDWW